ncbi:hypothetical protein [Methanobacterium sp. ACI-7]|uniref:hypothetical protein n=1 Tax=unclassified Methanobacterium TaxID=2627676 RepID=UPI0039C225E5
MSYSRKISSKEAESGFIFVLKSKLSFFPEDTFKLSQGDLSKDVKVESYPCTCRGPDTPHEHYYISWDSLEGGDKIEITKNNMEYSLKIIK